MRRVRSAGGHSLHLWARRPESLDPFRGTGATLHASAADVAREADVVFTMVAYPVESRIVPDLGSSGRNVTGTTHTYSNTDEPAVESTLARIWGGMHFRTSVEHGIALGQSTADWVADRHFQPVGQ